MSGNPYFDLNTFLIMFGRLAAAVIAGAIVGLERSHRFKTAGVRTHAIVCCAAALFMLISKYGFLDLSQGGIFIDGVRGADPARIAAAVASGMGFLGAGAIFKSGDSVHGLTTAAGLWATAAIGLAMGAGMYYLGLGAAILIFIVEMLAHKVTVGGDSYESAEIKFTYDNQTDFLPKFNEYLNEKRVIVVNRRYDHGEANLTEGFYVIRIADSKAFDEILEHLAATKEVKKFRGGSPIL